MKTAVIYWSGSGNTEAMANAVLEGMKEAGAEAVLMTPDQVNAGALAEFSGIALGCPAMGAEVLEESEFEPMYQSIKGSLSGKKIGLFGSYGWGTGEWMDSWKSDCENSGISLEEEPVICQESPDDDALAQCKALGKALV